MIRVHNIDPGSCLHPSSRGFQIFVPGQSGQAFVANVAESALVAGTPLTLVVSGTAGIGPAGYVGGTPMALAFLMSGAVTIVLRVVGINQFGKQVTEDVTLAAATVWSLNAYKQILSITPVSVGASANTISVGILLTAGVRIGLPFRPTTNLQGGTTLASFQQKLEVVGLFTAGAANVMVQTAAAAIDQARATLTLAATITAGMNWLITNYTPKGFRAQ